jgi:hypothetical protein
MKRIFLIAGIVACIVAAGYWSGELEARRQNELCLRGQDPSYKCQQTRDAIERLRRINQTPQEQTAR